MQFPVTEHVVKTPRHTSFYLACGVVDAPLIIFVHGWPELSISWRHQLHCFASLGFRVIAPDMRGYGRSTVHPNTSDYSVQAAVTDMIELLDALGSRSALWVGHDWGAPVVWGLAQHHPARVEGAANLCVPYLPEGFAPVNVIPLVDRSLYPANEYPAGQWDYQLFYAESFDRASATFDANPRNLIKALFRKGDPAGRGKPGDWRQCDAMAAGSEAPHSLLMFRWIATCLPTRICTAMPARLRATGFEVPTLGT